MKLFTELNDDLNVFRFGKEFLRSPKFIFIKSGQAVAAGGCVNVNSNNTEEVTMVIKLEENMIKAGFCSENSSDHYCQPHKSVMPGHVTIKNKIKIEC